MCTPLSFFIRLDRPDPFTVTTMIMMQMDFPLFFSSFVAIYLCYLYAVYRPPFIFILCPITSHTTNSRMPHASITCISVDSRKLMFSKERIINKGYDSWTSPVLVLLLSMRSDGLVKVSRSQRQKEEK